MTEFEPKDEQLDVFAELHISRHEVPMLVKQAMAYLDRYPDGRVPAQFQDESEMALLEAWLVHVRLLDELQANWERARRDEPLQPIDPLP